MNKKKELHMYKLLNALSLAMDFSKTGLMNHHQRVALLALKIAETIKLPRLSREQLFCSAIIHDAGSSTWREKAKLEQFEVENPWDHCRKGYSLLKQMDILAPVARIVFCHHDRWEGNNPSGLTGDEIPLESRIIHLADRVDVLTRARQKDILNYKKEIIDQIRQYSGTLFDPDIVSVFAGLAEKESLWLDLSSRFIRHHVDSFMAGCSLTISPGKLVQISEMFAQIIDGKSPFTYRHSRLVSETAAFLAAKSNLNDHEVENMRVAGLLHDLGKLTVPDEILEKPGSLTKNEFNVIKQHTYYTYQILNLIEGFETINKWASFHHEKLNGTGYPFHVSAENLCRGARIMAVSDIFSALAEDRPYRTGLPRKKILHILEGQVASNAVDGETVALLKENISHLEQIAYRQSNGNVFGEKRAYLS